MCDDTPKIGSDGFARYRRKKMQSQEIDCRCVHIKRKSSICQELGELGVNYQTFYAKINLI